MVENVDELAEKTIILHLTEVFRKQLTTGQWDRGIPFYLLHLFKDLIPLKYIKKVFSIVSKYPQYMYAEEIERISFPQFRDPNLPTKGYYAILATRKGEVPPHEKFIGHLFYVVPEEFAIVGIWPLENRFHVKDLSNEEIKKKVMNELKMFTKPKLWESLMVLMPLPKSK